MQVQKITFTPTFKTQQIKKYNQNISNPIQDNSRLDNIDYSKIAFCEEHCGSRVADI